MKELFNDFIKPFLENDIIINWVAPIITGLLVLVIPSILVKIFQTKKDEKKIKTANQRFLDAVRPYIIQEIEISAATISNIRNVVVKESGLKDKFISSELDLRNKLIMDITESKYIDENNKEKLMNFATKVFDSFDNISNDVKEEVKEHRFSFLFENRVLIMTLIIFILSSLFILIGTIYGHEVGLDPDNNYSIVLPLVTGLLSVISIGIYFISNVFESKVTDNKKSSFYYDFNDSLIYDFKKYNSKNKK